MNALRLGPPERTFADFYEGRRSPRFSRKTLLAVGITALCYGAIGFYFMTQKYDIVPLKEPAEPPTIVMEPWRPAPPIITPTEQTPQTTAAPVPVPARTTANVVPTAEPLPFMPSDSPPFDVVPTTADPEPTPVAPTAEPAPAGPPGVIRNPVWISRPTAEQVGNLYPDRAAERGITGSATLLCGIRPNGAMTDCQVIEESPGGWQFGKAAMAMARYFRISPKMIDGQAVEGFKVRIPVTFSLAG